MDEIKVNAVNLKSVDYMESDKILTLFTYEKGLLSARIKGVKKAQAKLKFASEPFCFGEYLLCGSRGGGYIVTGCSYNELFYGLRDGIDKFSAACVMLEYCLTFVQEEEPNTKLFALLLNSLNALCYGGAPVINVLLHFLLNALKACGYGTDYARCFSCKEVLTEEVYMDLQGGGFLCPDCRGEAAKPVSQAVFKVFKFISETPAGRLSTLKFETKNMLSALKSLTAFMYEISGKNMNSIKEFMNAIT